MHHIRAHVRAAHAQANKLVCEELAWGLREKKTKNVQLCKPVDKTRLLIFARIPKKFTLRGAGRTWPAGGLQHRYVAAADAIQCNPGIHPAYVCMYVLPDCAFGMSSSTCTGRCMSKAVLAFSKSMFAWCMCDRRAPDAGDNSSGCVSSIIQLLFG